MEHALYDMDEDIHPLDTIEHILTSHNWIFTRMSTEELTVTLTGEHTDYELYFLWDHDFKMLQICCQFNVEYDDADVKSAREFLMQLNEDIWLGHFTLSQNSKKPNLRYTLILNSKDSINHDQTLNDAVTILLSQCEKFAPSIKLLKSQPHFKKDDISLALMDAAGHS